jgi:hypothetical protein
VTDSRRWCCDAAATRCVCRRQWWKPRATPRWILHTTGRARVEHSSQPTIATHEARDTPTHHFAMSRCAVCRRPTPRRHAATKRRSSRRCTTRVANRPRVCRCAAARAHTRHRSSTTTARRRCACAWWCCAAVHSDAAFR